MTGGTTSTKASYGTVYTISLSANAVGGYEELGIIITPGAKFARLPISWEFIGVLSLSPDGLDLIEPASVTIRLPHSIDFGKDFGIPRSDGIQDFAPLPLSPREFGKDSVKLRLTHFSEDGIASEGPGVHRIHMVVQILITTITAAC